MSVQRFRSLAGVYRAGPRCRGVINPMDASARRVRSNPATPYCGVRAILALVSPIPTEITMNTSIRFATLRSNLMCAVVTGRKARRRDGG